MREIVIRKKDRLTTIVDNEDYEVLSRAKLEFDGRYAVQRRVNGKKLYLHQIIIGSTNHLIDHINRNKLDNRKSNLRTANKSINAFNTDLRADNKTGFKGVSYINARKYYQVRYGNIHIGCFKTLCEAIGARAGAEQCL